jgi:hypothetical protein
MAALAAESIARLTLLRRSRNRYNQQSNYLPDVMNSSEFGQYLDETGDYQKPWMLVQLRLAKLAEQKDDMLPQEYIARLEDIHQDLMRLGHWWEGQEEKVF